MKPRKLFWHLFPTYLAITVLCLVILGWLGIKAFRGFYLAQVESDLQHSVYLARELACPAFQSPDFAGLDSLAESFGNMTSCRITLIDITGLVLGDTHEDAATMENHADRPDFKAAMAGHVKTIIRFSTTLEEPLMYLAAPVYDDSSEIIGVIRVAIPLMTIKKGLNQFSAHLLLSAMLVALLAVLVSYLVSRRITKPLRELASGAKRYAAGHLDTRLLPTKVTEFAALAEALTSTAQQLSERFQTILKQRGELDAVLASMEEGVVALDQNARVITINKAAFSLLGIRASNCLGKTMAELVRCSELQRLAQSIQMTNEAQETEISLEQGTRHIHVNGSMLKDAAGVELGILLVFNDVTRLRRLETVRKDFAANVSHELRTPLTVVKGYVETLRDGAMEDPATAERFLEKASGQIDRLNLIIEDLLYLARLEESHTEITQAIPSVSLQDSLEKSLFNFQTQAVEKGISLILTSTGDQRMKVDPFLIERALDNLIHNALKNTATGGSVEIGWERDPEETRLVVRDNGCGIAEKHLPRLFERFYRVDTDRNRKQGGTGLGLAIVRHIALAHGGSVTVESELGVGSVFRIHLPGTLIAD